MEPPATELPTKEPSPVPQPPTPASEVSQALSPTASVAIPPAPAPASAPEASPLLASAPAVPTPALSALSGPTPTGKCNLSVPECRNLRSSARPSQSPAHLQSPRQGHQVLTLPSVNSLAPLLTLSHGSASQTHAPSPGIEKSMFAGSLPGGARPLPSIHTFAGPHSSLPPGGAYDRSRQADNKPQSGQRMGFGGVANFPSLSSIAAARDGNGGANAPNTSHTSGPSSSSSSRPLLPGINQLSPPLGSSLLHGALNAPYRNPMSVSSMLSGPPRDHSMSVYATQPSHATANGGPSPAVSAAPQQPQAIPPYDPNRVRRDDSPAASKLSGPSSGPTNIASVLSPAIANARRSDLSTNDSTRSGTGSLNGSPRILSASVTGASASLASGEGKDKDAPTPTMTKLPERSSYPPLPSAFARESPYSPWPHASNAASHDESASSSSSTNQTPSYGSRHMPTSTQIDPKIAPPTSGSAFGASKSNFYPSLNAYRQTNAPPPHRSSAYPWTALGTGTQIRGDYPEYYSQQQHGVDKAATNNGHAHPSPQIQASQAPGGSTGAGIGSRNGSQVPPSQGGRPESYKATVPKPFGRFPDVHPSHAPRAQQTPSQNSHLPTGQPSQSQSQSHHYTQQLHQQQLQPHSHPHQQSGHQNGFGGRRDESPHLQAGASSIPPSPVGLKRRRSADGPLGGQLEGLRPAKVVRPPPPFSAKQLRKSEIRSPLVKVDSSTVWKAVAVASSAKEAGMGGHSASIETKGGQEAKTLDKGKEKAKNSEADAEADRSKKERPYLGKVVYDPFVNPATLIDGDVLRNGVGGVVEVALPTSLFDGCRYEVGPPELYEGDAVGIDMEVDVDERDRQQLAVPGEIFDLEALRRRKVWGTDSNLSNTERDLSKVTSPVYRTPQPQGVVQPPTPQSHLEHFSRRQADWPEDTERPDGTSRPKVLIGQAPPLPPVFGCVEDREDEDESEHDEDEESVVVRRKPGMRARDRIPTSPELDDSERPLPFQLLSENPPNPNPVPIPRPRLSPKKSEDPTTRKLRLRVSQDRALLSDKRQTLARLAGIKYTEKPNLLSTSNLDAADLATEIGRLADLLKGTKALIIEAEGGKRLLIKERRVENARLRDEIAKMKGKPPPAEKERRDVESIKSTDDLIKINEALGRKIESRKKWLGEKEIEPSPSKKHPNLEQRKKLAWVANVPTPAQWSATSNKGKGKEVETVVRKQL
ncbi:hypothetical protein P7C70_g986, partial [Phenoliferia sp. Uapishka_3]